MGFPGTVRIPRLIQTHFGRGSLAEALKHALQGVDVLRTASSGAPPKTSDPGSF